MIALRLVLDTNVVVSAALKPEGLQRTVVLLALKRPARLYISQPILEEYRSVLARRELGISKGLRQRFLQLIVHHSHMVQPGSIPVATRDPADHKFLECAEAGRADYLVTGNERHYPKFWKSAKIINSREFLTIVAPHLIA